MALTNFSLPFGSLAQSTHSWSATISPLHPVHQLATNTNNLLYSPADHQQQQDDGQAPPAGADFYKNNPYAPPQQHQQQQQQQQQQTYQYNTNSRYKNNAYLPPIPTSTGVRNTVNFNQQQQQPPQQQQQQISHINTQQQYNSNNNNVVFKTQTAAVTTTASRTYGEGTYSRYPGQQQQQQQQQTQQQQHQQQPQQHQFFNTFNTKTRTAATTTSSFNTQQTVSQLQQPQQQQQNFNNNKVEPPTTVYGAVPVAAAPNNNNNNNDGFPERPPGFTRVQAGQGSRTQVHAVLDYDADEGEEDYYDENDQGEAVSDGNKESSMPTVTPIQGPIFLKNGTVPVVPLFSYPTINNGSFVQIPIWWTALSVALGLDVRGDIIKGVPCIKRYHQLFCPTAGNTYPIDKIERFIDDNKALMRRMYGDFEMNMDAGGPRQQTKQRRRRFIDEPDIFIPPGVFPAVIPPDDVEGPHRTVEQGESYFGKLRDKRQASANQKRGGGASKAPTAGPNNPGSSTGRLDACESKIEIVTPYWASNSAGKIRAIVNTQHFEQAIHQEICSKTSTSRCKDDCGCEQKYKWHRLLSYDPDNDCKGIFMDWFLFPSCCVCRCNP